MTAFLLDTHAALWWWTNDPKLGPTARQAIEDNQHPIYLSAASVWEIGIKSNAGRLPEIVDFRGQYANLLETNGFNLLPITDLHALAGAFLVGKHRDPFDRLIAAQAIAEHLTVLTRDSQIGAFGCKVLW